MTAEIDWEFTAQARLEEIQRLNAELAQAMALVNFHREPLVACRARLAAAERVVKAARSLEAVQDFNWPGKWRVQRVVDAIAAYDRRAPEGGSTPPAAIERTDLNISDREGK